MERQKIQSMKNLIVAISLLLTVEACGQGKFVPGKYISGNDTLPYQLYIPGKTVMPQKYPLVLFLHGAGERGNDNQLQLNYISDVVKTQWFKQYNAVVLAPQCPKGKRWVEVDWGLPSHTMPGQPSEPMRLTMQLLDSIIKKYPVDTNRIYVVGLSMGGFGVWDALARYPDKFAAGVPICGGADTATAAQIARIPVWVFHGSNDRVVKVSRSRDMVNALRKHGGKPIYTEYKGVGHGAWFKALPDQKMWRWLFSQKKKTEQ